LSTQSSRISWLLIGLAALVVAFLPAPAGAAPIPTQRHFSLQASQYAYAPAELHVNAGDTVTIELVSTDAVHGLYVDGYGVSMEADPGQSVSLTFVADQPGSFRFRCNVTCGALHPFMIGKMTVGGNTLLYRGVGIALLGLLGAMLTLRRPAESGTPA
jgi:plastocyanin